MHFFLRPLDDNSVQLRRVACTAFMSAAEIVSLEIAAPAGSLIESLRPRAVLGGMAMRNLTLTFDAPARVAMSAEGGVDTELLLILDRLRTVGLILDGDGRVLARNKLSEGVLGDGLTVREGLLAASSPAGKAILNRLLRGQNQDADGGPVLLPGPVTVDRCSSLPFRCRHASGWRRPRVRKGSTCCSSAIRPGRHRCCQGPAAPGPVAGRDPAGDPCRHRRLAEAGGIRPRQHREHGQVRPQANLRQAQCLPPERVGPALSPVSAP